MNFDHFYPAGDGTYRRTDGEALLEVKELTDTTLDVVLKLSDLSYIKLDDWAHEIPMPNT